MNKCSVDSLIAALPENGSAFLWHFQNNTKKYFDFATWIKYEESPWKYNYYGGNRELVTNHVCSLKLEE